MPKPIIAADTTSLNSQIFFDRMDLLMGASIGVIVIRTREFDRARQLLHEWSSTRNLSYAVWDRLRGIQNFASLPVTADNGNVPKINVSADRLADFLKPTETIQGTDGLIGALDHIGAENSNDRINDEKPGTVYCFHNVTPDELSIPLVHQHVYDHVRRAYDKEDRLIFLVGQGVSVPDELLNDVEIIDLSTPSFAELAEALSEFDDDIAQSLEIELDEDARYHILQNALGMTRQEFQNGMSLAIVDIANQLDDDDEMEITSEDFVKIIRQRKLEILKQTQILELMKVGDMSNVGGLDLLKAELELQKNAFSDEARQYGVSRPKGFIVVGPPGAGKSLIGKATAQSLGLPGINFRMAEVYNSLVGSSEQRMRTCLSMVADMAPCVLFVDEIDKVIPPADGGNDGGVSSRILGTFLTWLNDREENGIPVYVIASANDISRLPPEILRHGRFDDKWAVSFPTAEERAEIFRIHVEKRKHKLTKVEYERLANESDQFVGAEIESVVEKAILVDFNEGEPKLRVGTVSDQISKLKPQAKSFPERIKFMSDWVEKNARPSSSSRETLKQSQTSIPIKRRLGSGKRSMRSSSN
jgi:SpoVK/Ycf46/Vps4 family AAA+-type ATPase